MILCISLLNIKIFLVKIVSMSCPSSSLLDFFNPQEMAMPGPSNFFKKYISHLTDVPPALGFYWCVRQRSHALINLRPRVTVGLAHTPGAWWGWEDLPQQCGPLCWRRFPLRAYTNHLASVSNWQSLLSPCSKRYWYRVQLYVWPSPIQLFPISTDPQKCVFISANKKKRSPYFFAQIFPSFCITSIFSERQIFLTEDSLNIY